MKYLERDIKNKILGFCQKNNCIDLQDEIFKFICSDDVEIFTTVNNEKKLFYYQLRLTIQEINNELKRQGKQPKKINVLDIDAIEEKYYDIKTKSNNWQRNMREAICSYYFIKNI